MWRLKNKQSQRHFYILSEYFINNRKFSLDELVILLNSNIKTILKTISDINEIYNVPYLYFDSKTQVLMCVESTNYFYLDVFSDFYDNTQEFNILEYIFIHGPISNSKLCSELHISNSTLNRNLAHLRNNLKKYGISISKQNLMFTGKEMTIRHFFVQYYYEKNTCGIFEDFEYFQEVSYSIFKRLSNNTQFSKYKPFFNYYRWIMFVSAIRMSTKNYITHEQDVDKGVVEVLRNHIQEQDRRTIEHTFHFSTNDNHNLYELMYLFLPSKYTQQLNTDYLFNETKKVYLEIVNRFQLKLSDSEQSSIIDSIFKLMMSYSGRPYFLFNVNRHNFNILRNNFPESTEVFLDIMRRFFSNMQIEDDDRLYSMCISVLDFTPGIYESWIEFEKRIEISLFLVANQHHSTFVHRLLTNRFSNLAVFKLCDSDILLSKEDVSTGIWISDIATLKSENVLIIESKTIYTEMPRIKQFLFEQRNLMSKLNQK